MAGPVHVLSPEQKAEKIKQIVDKWYATAKTTVECDRIYKASTDMMQLDGLLQANGIKPYVAGKKNPIYWGTIDYEKQVRRDRLTLLLSKK